MESLSCGHGKAGWSPNCKSPSYVPIVPAYISHDLGDRGEDVIPFAIVGLQEHFTYAVLLIKQIFVREPGS